MSAAVIDERESANAGSPRSGDKITLRLSQEARETLEWISDKYGHIPLSEVIRRALGTEKYLLQQKDKGASILIEESSGRVKELVLR